MAMPVTRHYTAADITAMPDDGQRYEILRGELLVSPPPGLEHQTIVTRLLLELGPILKTHGLADQLLTPPAEITLRGGSAILNRSVSWTGGLHGRSFVPRFRSAS